MRGRRKQSIISELRARCAQTPQESNHEMQKQLSVSSQSTTEMRDIA
jgi:hypothetical protein